MFTVNNTWMLVSTFLVFIMHLGFASLETGLTQSKNTVNILFKNVSIIAIGILTYALCGFSNFASIGIQLGGIGAMAPDRKKDLAKLVTKAMFGGAIASWLTATIAGLLL